MDFRDKISFENRWSFHIVEDHAHSRSRTPLGCVDRNHMSTWNTRLVFSRTPLGCVDRNRDEVGKWIPAGVAPHWGAWIEINEN